MRCLPSLLVIAVLCTSTIHGQGSAIPNCHLRVTVQQKEDGRIEKGYHILEIRCWDGQCDLITVSLNQCAQWGVQAPSFYPAIQHSSSWKGNLRVRNEGNTLIVEESGSDMGGDFSNSMRFEYENPNEWGVVSRLTGFSGGFVKNSLILDKILTVQYVPLPLTNQVIALDCGVRTGSRPGQ